MTWIRKKIYLAAIPLSVALYFVSAVSVRANSQRDFIGTQKLRTDLISQNIETKERGTLPASAGGATRGGCAEQAPSLISVMPKNKVGLTFNKYPTFFWHIAKSNAKTAEFLLLNENDDVIYETNFNLPDKPGIFAFTLPPEAPGLEINQKYHWFLSVNCSSEDTDDTMTVEGWVERTRPNLFVRIKLNKLEPKYRSKIYTEAGIWLDAITHVAKYRCTLPHDSDVKLYWDQLLTSIGFPEFVSEPLDNSCSLIRLNV